MTSSGTIERAMIEPAVTNWTRRLVRPLKAPPTTGPSARPRAVENPITPSAQPTLAAGVSAAARLVIAAWFPATAPAAKRDQLQRGLRQAHTGQDETA